MKASFKRKGIFFTFIAITIIAIFVLVFTPQSGVSLQKDTQAVKSRISSIDNYINDLQERYFEDELRASGYKTILSLIFYMNSTGSYISNLDSAFSEVILTGKINGVAIDSITGKKIMENSTLADWNSKIIQTAADTLNVNTTIKVNSISVSQSKPWDIDVQLSVDFSVQSNAAQWQKSSRISTAFGIEGLPDPYYLVNSNGLYSNPIKKSSTDFNQWSTAQVRLAVRNGTYVHWEGSDAPSFLMRFTNTISNSSCCGIESLVNPNMIVPSDRIDSYADYLLWSHRFAGNCTQLYNITGLWDEFKYFKLDVSHVALYNITAQDAVKTC